MTNGTTDEKLQELENLKINNETYLEGVKELKDVILNTSPSGFGLYINKNTLQNAFLEYDEFVNIKTLKKIQH